jgi:hypothetical protein
LAIVLPLDRWAPSLNRPPIAGTLLLLSAVAVYSVLKWLVFRSPSATGRAQDLALLSVVCLASLLATDVAFTAYSNFDPAFRLDQIKMFGDRSLDRFLWDGELQPDIYFPNGENFWVHKPGQRRIGYTYGEHYYRALLDHALLRDSVLDFHFVEYHIDQYGFRNSISGPENVKTIVLGDSFCYGYQTTQQSVFSQILASRIGEPVYNMGISGTSPLQQLLLFEYFLKTYPDQFRPKKLLWMIFEGNDLEETYQRERPGASHGRGFTEIFDHTAVGLIAAGPSLLRGQSVLRLLTGGQLQLNLTAGKASRVNHYRLDGETIAHPLYQSERFGYRLFRQAYVDRAAQPRSYVLNHPNFRSLQETVSDMAGLAHARGFDVTIVTVPSDARLYRHAFEDLPTQPEEPFFRLELQRMARSAGFSFIDLENLLTPFANNELLYRRDDTHWNERGHYLVAQVLAKNVFGVPASEN